VKVAFVGGFFAPAEVVIKAHFLAPFHSRQLIWIPDTGLRRDPNISLLVNEINQSLLGGHDPRLILARPHDPNYSPTLQASLGAMLGRHPKAKVDLPLEIPPRKTELVVAELLSWLGRDSFEKLPTYDSLVGWLRGSRIVCVSHRHEPSFATVFTNLGLTRQEFSALADELRINSASELSSELRRTPKPRGPLLYAFHRLGRDIPQDVRYEFAGHSVIEGTALDATVTFLHQSRLERQRRDLAEARRVQSALMPGSLFSAVDLTIASQFLPSQSIGGDFFDWFELPDGRLAIVVADVSGKGAGAALLAAQTQSVIRSAITNGCQPSEVSKCVHDELVRINGALGSVKYVELFCGLLDRKDRLLSYFYAGHTRPIIRRADGAIDLLDVTGTLPGMAIPGHLPNFEETNVKLNLGDRLLVFTDGVGEFEDHDRLIGALNTHASEPAEVAARMLMRFAEERVSVFEDDATLILLAV
jgi:serine phosphatase RsbU (regulator of sigma subunit)